jgi:superkiller protein 3
LRDLALINEKLRKNPNNPWALKLAGDYYLREGSYKQAEHYYNQAVAIEKGIFAEVVLDHEREILKNPAKLGPRFSLTGFYLAQGEIDAAVMELEEGIELNPENVQAYNLLGKIYVKQGRFDEVISLLEKSVKKGIKDVSLIEILAGAYLEKGRTKDALKFYEEVLNSRPGDKQILRILGELYTRLENYDKAARCYQSMFSDDPEVSREVIQRLEGLLKKLEGNVPIREILADIYMKSLDPEAAVIKLCEIIRLDALKLEEVIIKLKIILKSYPGHPQAVLALADALRRQGNFSESIENYFSLVKAKPEFIDAVMDGYREVLEYCPEQALAHAYLAEAYFYKNQIKEALEEYEKMVMIDPGSADTVIKKCREIIKVSPQILSARLVLGRAYLAKGDVQRAAVEAEGVLLVDKKFTPAYLLLGEAYYKLKMCKKAVEALRTALLHNPYEPRVLEKFREVKVKEIDLEIEKIRERIIEDPWKISLHLDLAKLYIQKEMRDEAIRELQIALKDQVRAPFACNLLGCLYRGEGRYDLAAAQFNRALELAPSELSDLIRTVRFNLGSAYEAQGLIGKALKIYESVLLEDIDFGDLKKRISYLKSTSLKSMGTKSLLMVFSNISTKEVVSLWGREGKNGKNVRENEISLSFGQNHNSSGFEYFMKGMFKAALDEFELAVQLDVKFAAALNNLAVSLIREGKFYEARARLEDAVDLNPNSVVFRNNLGVVYFMLGKFKEAYAEFEKAFTLDSGCSGVCLNFGDLNYLKKNIKQAFELYSGVGKFDVLTEIADQRLAFKTP